MRICDEVKHFPHGGFLLSKLKPTLYSATLNKRRAHSPHQTLQGTLLHFIPSAPATQRGCQRVKKDESKRDSLLDHAASHLIIN